MRGHLPYTVLCPAHRIRQPFTDGRMAGTVTRVSPATRRRCVRCLAAETAFHPNYSSTLPRRPARTILCSSRRVRTHRPLHRRSPLRFGRRPRSAGRGRSSPTLPAGSRRPASSSCRSFAFMRVQPRPRGSFGRSASSGPTPSSRPCSRSRGGRPRRAAAGTGSASRAAERPARLICADRMLARAVGNRIVVRRAPHDRGAPHLRPHAPLPWRRRGGGAGRADAPGPRLLRHRELRPG